MPVVNHKARKPFYQWGKSGKKYYYDPTSKESKEKAKEKAKKQGAAIKISEIKKIKKIAKNIFS